MLSEREELEHRIKMAKREGVSGRELARMQARLQEMKTGRATDVMPVGGDFGGREPADEKKKAEIVAYEKSRGQNVGQIARTYGFDPAFVKAAFAKAKDAYRVRNAQAKDARYPGQVLYFTDPAQTLSKARAVHPNAYFKDHKNGDGWMAYDGMTPVAWFSEGKGVVRVPTAKIARHGAKDADVMPVPDERHSSNACPACKGTGKARGAYRAHDALDEAWKSPLGKTVNIRTGKERQKDGQFWASDGSLRAYGDTEAEAVAALKAAYRTSARDAKPLSQTEIKEMRALNDKNRGLGALTPSELRRVRELSQRFLDAEQYNGAKDAAPVGDDEVYLRGGFTGSPKDQEYEVGDRVRIKGKSELLTVTKRYEIPPVEWGFYNLKTADGRRKTGYAAGNLERA